MFRVSRKGERIDDADTIEGAREIVREQSPGRYDVDEIRADPMSWIKRWWVGIASLLSALAGLVIAAFRLGGWGRITSLSCGVALLLGAVSLAVRKIYRRESERRLLGLTEIGRLPIIPSRPKSIDRQLATEIDRWPLLPSRPKSIDRHVRFTVYRPEKVRPETWYTMLAFAYRGGDPEEGGLDIKESFKEVESRAATLLGPQIQSFASLSTDSRQDIPREGTLRFVPRVEGLVFNPPERSFEWVERIHQEIFRFRTASELVEQVVRGRMEVYLGVILIAEIGLAIAVDDSVEATDSLPNAVVHGSPYRHIFASYSHKDLSIVRQFEIYAVAFGDEFMRDWTYLRAGEVWSEGLQSMISKADIFQLFWSTNSMESEFVRQEWEYALSLSRPSFIRPVYWEEPMPERSDRGLPPETLRRLHFHRVSLPPRDIESDTQSRLARMAKERAQLETERIRMAEERPMMLWQLSRMAEERRRLSESISRSREELRYIQYRIHKLSNEILMEKESNELKERAAKIRSALAKEEELVKVEMQWAKTRHALDRMEAERARMEAERGRVETEWTETRDALDRMEAERARMEAERAAMAEERARMEAVHARWLESLVFRCSRFFWLPFLTIFLLILAKATHLLPWPWWLVFTLLFIITIPLVVFLLQSLLQSIRDRS